MKCLWLDDDRARWPGVSGFLREKFDLLECSNYEDALEFWEREPIEVLIVDAIIPFGSARPSVDPYLGLAFAEELLIGNGSKPRCLAFLTVIENEEIESDVRRLKQLGIGVDVNVEYFNKTDVLLSGVERFVERLYVLSSREKK